MKEDSILNAPCGVVFCMAGNYWPHVAVAVYSAVIHADNLDINIFYETANSRWQKKIAGFVKKYGSRVRFTAFDKSLVSGIKPWGYYSGYMGISSQYRLCVPEMLSQTQNKVLFLDSDLILRGSVRDILNIPLHGKILGARPDYRLSENQSAADRLDRSAEIPYFNAGVMIIDLAGWKQARISERCLEFLRKFPDKCRYAEQDALNHVIGNDFSFLPCRYNMMVDDIAITPSTALQYGTYEEIRDAVKNPLVVHFNGQFKPWHLTYAHPWKRAYSDLRRKLQPWPPYISDDLDSLVLRIFKRLKNVFIFKTKKVAL